MSRKHINRILIIAAHSGIGTVHVDKLFPSLVRLGYEITYIGWDREKVLSKRFTKNSIDYRMIYSGWGFANKWLALALPIWVTKAFFELSKLKKKQFPVIMTIDFDSALPQIFASRFNKIPFIYNIRDNFAMRTTIPKLLRPVIERLDKIVISKAESVIVPDENRITSTDYVKRRKYNVIHNAAIEIKPPEGISIKRPFTVYAMGYLQKARGIHLLIDAMNQLDNARLLIAGKMREKDLKNKIKQSSIIDYRGWIEPVEALKLCFESDVIFTFYDPVSEINRKAASNKWFDAMMAGIPILVNEEVERSDWIKNYDIGYTCPYGNVKALVNMIKHINTHPEEASKKGQNGRRLYEQGYSWKVSERKFDSVIRKLLPNNEVKERI